MRAAVSAGDRELPCTATSAPASASAIAIAAPMPADAPVTSATCPSSLKASRLLREAAVIGRGTLRGSA